MVGRPRLTRRTAAALLAAVVTGTLAACTGTTDGSGSSGTSADRPANGATPSRTAPSASSVAPSASSSAGDSACPTSYAAPDPRRPSVRLRFDVADDLRSVRGTESITFRPDRPVTELVFRLTANTRPSVQEGNRIQVLTAQAAPAGGRYRFSPANADPGTQGGLLRIPLGRTVPAGGTATARLTFTLTLGEDAFDRFGETGGYAYFGSGHPLLAWERGYGWHTEDMIDFTAESATSEAMDTDLEVTAPAKDTVIASGNPVDPQPAPNGRRLWTSHLDAARDVSVAVGPFRVRDRTVNGVKLRVGAYSDAIVDALTPEFVRAITELANRLGPFPFPSLAVARVPASGGGIEYPGSILMLDGSRLVSVHETAHQWFYAMVGNSQSQHPWLDEAFAQYTEQLVDGGSQPGDLAAPGRVDSSVQSYGQDVQGYYFTTYNKGAAALEAARAAAGASRWDAAVKCYVARNAWRIVDPADFRAAIAGLPAAVSVLRKAGALK